MIFKGFSPVLQSVLNCPHWRLRSAAKSIIILLTPGDTSSLFFMSTDESGVTEIPALCVLFFPLCSSEVHALNIPTQVFVPLFCFPSDGIIHGGFVPGGCVASILSCKGTGMVKGKNLFTTSHATLRDQCLKVKKTGVSGTLQSTSKLLTVLQSKAVATNMVASSHVRICNTGNTDSVN